MQLEFRQIESDVEFLQMGSGAESRTGRGEWQQMLQFAAALSTYAKANMQLDVDRKLTDLVLRIKKIMHMEFLQIGPARESLQMRSSCSDRGGYQQMLQWAALIDSARARLNLDVDPNVADAVERIRKIYQRDLHIFKPLIEAGHPIGIQAALQHCAEGDLKHPEWLRRQVVSGS